jgi:outer membrane protein W
MVKNLLLGIVFLLSISAFAQQDKKWNVEANYTIIPNDGFGGDDDIIEIGLKYRFADLNFVQFGFGINAGFSNDNFNDTESVEGKFRGLYFQPRAFAEFSIPGIQKLRPSIGLGYSIVDEDLDVISIGEEIKINTTNGGFNFNIGVSYDITKRFFIQAQYDFISLKVRDEFLFQGEMIRSDFTAKLNNFKIGIGFRF